MEQCGESVRKRLVMISEDRISDLPKDLILKILSYLPTKKVITTSVISKRWRSLWKIVPKLKFDTEYHLEREFSRNVSTTLLSHKAPVLDSLHLIVNNGSSKDIGEWVDIAIARHVCELVLDLYCRSTCIRFPWSIFTFSNTLETLKLEHVALVDVPSSFCMKSLRNMHFHYVAFKDNESFRNLISSCPNLENLVMYRLRVLLTFVIVAPSLKRLSITGYTSGIDEGGFVINAPSLRYLKIKEVSHCGCCLIENSPMLVEAKIRKVSYIANENIMGSLKSAKRLSLGLSALEIKYPTGSIFYQLIHLEIYTRKAEWWNLLTLMLDSSPQLQVLKLTDPWLDHSPRVVGGKWSQPENIPECLMSHLKMFAWTRFNWGSEQEKEVATYILKNARQLKSASFSTRPIHNSKKLNKLEERRNNVFKELHGVARASSCHLLFL